MARQTQALLSFNRGLVSPKALARIDLKRMALSAEIMVNWMPTLLGPMSLRAGLGYVSAIFGNSPARMLPFIFATTDTALLELTDSLMRVRVSDVLVTRPAVTSATVNGNFTVDLASWTDNDEAGAVSSWIAPGYMQLVGDGSAAAIRDQVVTVAGANVGVLHALRIVIPRGPVTLRVGTTAGDDGYINETVLSTGTHSLTLTPVGNFNIRFLSRQVPAVWVDSCNIEAAGVLSLPTPWAAADLSNVRIDQSGDVVFVACKNKQQRRIERRNGGSWSVVLYQSPDGPFMVQNVTPLSIAPSALTGNITLTASQPFFRTTHAGALFSLTSSSQAVSRAISAQNVFTNAIRVTGIGAARSFNIVLTNLSATGSTVTLQQSIGAPGAWMDITTWTADASTNYQDLYDNQIIYYRIGIKTGGYVAGTITNFLGYPTGSIRGIVRVTEYTNTTTVNAEVLTDLGATTATATWQEGQWSDKRGWPSAIAFYLGRLWWAGKGGIWGSIPDAFDSFDETAVGDSGPISRTIGSGPVDTINWLLALQRLLAGTQGSEKAVRSTSLDEPITPTNFNIKDASTQGSGALSPIKVDQTGIFVNRTGVRVYELAFSLQSYDYSATDLSAIVPDLGKPGLVRMDGHRKPDTRIHFIRSDGVANVLIRDKEEEVTCWLQVETDGDIEDVVCLPALDGKTDDQVYYVVKRTINGATVRYLEKWAQADECIGASLNKQADAFITFAGPISVLTGLSHLEGKQVVVWADGQDIGTNASGDLIYTVTSGQITLANAANVAVCVGLPYVAQFKSAKLGIPAGDVPSPLNLIKQIKQMGLILANYHPQGLKFGPDFDHLDDMPMIENAAPVGTTVQDSYDQDQISFPGTWTSDTRMCLEASAPRPVTVMACGPVLDIK